MADAGEFRLAVLNPGGRDPEQHFGGQSKVSSREHPPVNFHAFAACTNGAFFRETKAAIATGWPVLLLLRGDFRATERALTELKRAGCKVAVSLKETGSHQIAGQLDHATTLARFGAIVRKADCCLATTPAAAEFYRGFRSGGVEFIPTPYPVDDPNWDWSVENHSGIFVGTREFEVPFRNHLAALLAAKRLSEATGELVTVFNLERKRGARLIAGIGFRKVKVHEGLMNYRAYLGMLARHKIVFQLDRSRVPGQVAGDALLGRTVCVGGDGAIETLAFPESCGTNRTDDELIEIALRLLGSETERRAAAQRALSVAAEKLSFSVGRKKLARFFDTI